MPLLSLLLLTFARPGLADFEDVEVTAERLLGTDRASGSTSVAAEVVSLQANTLQVRFGLNVNADQDSAAEPVLEIGTARYTARFSIDNDRNYLLRITTQRIGAVRRLVDESGCSGFATLAAQDGPVVQKDQEPSRVLAPLALPEARIEAGVSGAFLPVNQTATLEGEVGDAGLASYTMTFSTSAVAFSDTCAVAVLLGAQNAATTGCIICEYPGDRSSIEVTDEGLFVELELIPQDCGTSSLQPGEECDRGLGNGRADFCCASDCRFRAPGEVCRAADGTCDKAETCSGASGVCGADEKQEDGFPCGPEEPCSRSNCQSGGFCTEVAKSGPCDDGQFCTSGDHCSASQDCVPGDSGPCKERPGLRLRVWKHRPLRPGRPGRGREHGVHRRGRLPVLRSRVRHGGAWAHLEWTPIHKRRDLARPQSRPGPRRHRRLRRRLAEPRRRRLGARGVPDDSRQNVLAAETCAGNFPQCDFSGWSRPFGPFLDLCSSCVIDNEPPTLRCFCRRADGQTISASSITLPCRGSVENDAGILTFC